MRGGEAVRVILIINVVNRDGDKDDILQRVSLIVVMLVIVVVAVDYY